MSKIVFAKWCVSIFLVTIFPFAQAATISLSPISQDVFLGNQVTMDLTMDFSDDPTLGGGIDIFYNSSLLSFQSFIFNPDLSNITDILRQPDVLTNELNGLTFVNTGSGISGPIQIGTLTFDTLMDGIVDFTMADNDTPSGGFFSASTFQQQTISYEGASVQIISAIPLPAAIWLLLSGVVWLGFGFRKRKVS